MVVLTVITTKNYHTVYLNEVLVNIKRIKLLSCSLYNSWYNLKREGSISIHESKDVTRILGKIYPGHYTIESLGKAINHLFEESENLKTSVQFNLTKGAMGIFNPKNRKIEFDRDLTDLLGFKERKKNLLGEKWTFVNRLNGYNNYFVKNL